MNSHLNAWLDGALDVEHNIWALLEKRYFYVHNDYKDFFSLHGFDKDTFFNNEIKWKQERTSSQVTAFS